MLSTNNREDSRQIISHFSLPSKKNKTYYFSESKNNHINTHIKSLDIADGLKELLIKYGFTLEVLLNTSSSEIAEFLGIDQHVAEIICTAARKSSNHYRQYHSMRFYP
jgi:PHP family Zn ribbon phosphoesterase